MNRGELAAFLRRSRERVRPEQVGLTAGSRRRTPGLRREEVALLAGISVDYVVRLEQGRGPAPSASVIGALARALRLEPAEHDALFYLAGMSPPGPGSIRMQVRPSVLRLLDRFHDLPVIVLSAKGDVLAWNAMSSALHGDWAALAPARRNLLRLRFLPEPTPEARSSVGASPAEAADADALVVASLRAAAARYPDDPALRSLIAELLAGSVRFAGLWESTFAGFMRSHAKTVIHPELGPLRLECDTLEIPDDDQQLIVYSAAPGTREAEALELLRVIGTQWPAPSSAE
ncbi:helix-turn-helix transcriptional regulator [Granulicoccus phenolivorans]|uniref:helix-turn-helix transcriptional regulator n=1 Tax=Granulicoccus phenolivorans TaxID=266854 RepID=UPI000427A647|nr:helix-turn-helix transcriptional regulator [Granulicoccus phenolivorans]